MSDDSDTLPVDHPVPGRGHGAPRANDPDTTGRPDVIGAYRILSEIGAGGMGTVYVAEQREPVKRRVALKVIKLGLDSREVLKRFALERQSLAVMNHPNIAKVLDAGSTERGQPYFVMEYVEGLPLTDYCDKHRLGVKRRVELFRMICDGVQHAHYKGVIHRDLKPGNVLVARDGERVVPKIIDFGLARATDQTMLEHSVFTEQGQLIGTPEYMSPEQARMDGEGVDTRTDVYSLGVMLYEVLSGALPFSSNELRRAGYLEIQRLLRDVEPPTPSSKVMSSHDVASDWAQWRRTSETGLSRSLRGDLDWIVMRAMAKEPERRYATPDALADDLGRYLELQPVLAGPPSATYRMKKWLRRYRVQAAAGTAVLLALIGGVAAASWQAQRALAAEKLARTAEDIAEQRANQIEAEKARVEVERDRADEENRRFRLVRYTLDLQDWEAELASLHPDPESWQRNWTALAPELERWLTARGEALVAAANEVEQALDALRARAAPLRAEDLQRTLEFEDGVDRFLFATLVRFREQMAAFRDEMTGTLSNARWRLEWARRVEGLTRGHPNATTTWKTAHDAIAKADGIVASKLYAQVPIDLQPQEGLVPIGMNPDTLLWEFYHLRSAWDPRLGRDPAESPIPAHEPVTGRIAVGEETGIVFVLIPGGTFTMGAQNTDRDGPNYDPQAVSDETPHQVTLAPYFLARHELTQAQWLRLSTDAVDPSRYGPGFVTDALDAPVSAAHPVELVDWKMCTGLLGLHGLLLPTEAQWEYGVRAGTTTAWCTGQEPESLEGFTNLLDQRAKRDGPWSGDHAGWDDAFVIHAPVGRFRPNDWGLHDVNGNVVEWCRDRFESYDVAWRAGDGLRLVTGETSPARITRGGAFDYEGRYARSAIRFKYPPAHTSHNLGVRPSRLITH